MSFSPSARARSLNTIPYKSGPIIYWMNRDQRVHDNWALLEAQAWAKHEGVPFAVAHNLVPSFLGGGERQWWFKTEGLKEVEKELHALGIPFYLFAGKESHGEMLDWCLSKKIGGLVTDFFPLRLSQKWVNEVTRKATFPVFQVDAHNIVPCWLASPKQEFAARTIRPKIRARLGEFLTEIPRLHPQTSHAPFTYQSTDWKEIDALCPIQETDRLDWIVPGEAAAKKAMRRFLEERLNGYEQDRNDANTPGLSDLSPYFHYGQLSPQRVAWEVSRSTAPMIARDAYLEEVIIRRELSDNFCFYQPHYDSFQGLPAWAQQTLNDHRKDAREFVYSYKVFAQARTHDDLWNAAQQQLLQTGKMHGYLRMYWAKKILEWTASPEDAMEVAIKLNDTYELDGRDPNGYVGVAWSVGGLHDRPWFGHPVYGTVRYMARSGCEKKFDVKAYIQRWNQE